MAVGLTPTRSHRLPVQRSSLSICCFTAFFDVLASKSVVCALFSAFQAVKRLLLSAVCRICLMK